MQRDQDSKAKQQRDALIDDVMALCEATSRPSVIGTPEGARALGEARERVIRTIAQITKALPR